MNEIKTILACVRTADKKYNLINPNDRIAVGISGGKDSMVLFYALHIYAKFQHKNFKIVPIMIDLGFDNFNPTPVVEWMKSLGHELKIYEAKSVYEILKANQPDEKHLPCSICSKMKKAIINKAAKLYKCNKVAFAHHVDDAIETLLMNSIYGGKIDTFSPKMYLSNDKMSFIRPLCLATEKDIIRTIKDNNIPVLKSNCPADKFTERENIKNMLSNLYKNYHMAHQNFINMLDNHENFYLWHEDRVSTIESTKFFIKECVCKDDFIQLNNFLVSNKKSTRLAISHSYYLVFDGSKVIGYFALNSNDPKNIVLPKIYIKECSSAEILYKEIEDMVFRKYNPCNFKIAAEPQYFSKSYTKSGKYYTKKL